MEHGLEDDPVRLLSVAGHPTAILLQDTRGDSAGE